MDLIIKTSSLVVTKISPLKVYQGQGSVFSPQFTVFGSYH